MLNRQSRLMVMFSAIVFFFSFFILHFEFGLCRGKTISCVGVIKFEKIFKTGNLFIRSIMSGRQKTFKTELSDRGLHATDSRNYYCYRSY